MPESSRLSYTEFIAFFNRNSFAQWRELVRRESEIPPQSIYEEWLKSETFAERVDIEPPKTVEFILHNSQIYNLPVQAVTLLPLPPPGIVYNVSQVVFIPDFGRGAYSNIDPDAYLTPAYAVNDFQFSALEVFQYIAQGAASAGTRLSTFLSGAPGAEIWNVFPLAAADASWGLQPARFSQIQNQLLLLYFYNNNLGPLTGGHVDNTLRVRVTYSELQL